MDFSSDIAVAVISFSYSKHSAVFIGSPMLSSHVRDTEFGNCVFFLGPSKDNQTGSTLDAQPSGFLQDSFVFSCPGASSDYTRA